MRSRHIFAPLLFNTCMERELRRAVDLSHCEASIGNNRVTDLVVNDAMILAESLEVLMLALEAMHEAKSCTKTKIQAFGGLLYETDESLRACGEGVEILEGFAYLGSVAHNSLCSMAYLIAVRHGHG